MNSTLVGAEFENKVFDYVSSLLDTEGFLGATKKYSKVFKHKKYKCASSDREIVFDITIETYNAQSSNEEWSSLIVIECKNYGKKVDIGDLDELAGKMNLISRSGIKGCMVTTVGYSITEINQAKKDHIALTVFANDEMEWYAYRNQHIESEFLMEILLGHKQVGCNPVTYDDGNIIDLLSFLKMSGAAISKRSDVFIPFYKDDTIKQKAGEIYRKCNFVTNDIAGEVLAKIYPDVKIRFDELQEGILGMFSFEERVITLSNTIMNDEHRRNFTLAHEIGHLCLHEPYIRNHAKRFVDYSMDKLKLMQDDMIKLMEQHANKFASFLLIPQDKLIAEVKELLSQTNNATGRFYLDNQICNIKDVDSALRNLSQIFHVSKEAMKIRLIKEGLLIDNSKGPQRISRLINK